VRILQVALVVLQRHPSSWQCPRGIASGAPTPLPPFKVDGIVVVIPWRMVELSREELDRVARCAGREEVGETLSPSYYVTVGSIRPNISSSDPECEADDFDGPLYGV